MAECTEFEMGLTIATMKPVTWYGLPCPSNHSYKPWAIRKRRGDFTYSGYGHPIGSWAWAFLSEGQMYQLMSFYDNDMDASVTLYIRTYKGQGQTDRIADFRVIMVRPVDGEGRSTMPKSPQHWSNVAVVFDHMVEI